MAKLTGNNEHNVTWLYARECYSALKNDTPVPPIPHYDIWESEETGGRGRVFVGKKLITPCKVSYGGVTLFGD